ncbi:long-chain-fatty-acid--CoA ligase FadD17 [Mycolicibacterium neoaurum]|uniref:long-chain-fatty-acid--CoA ligase FadD17 n=1 Tax=Mycolicibacterium neoaurum TaxID=1795 RepID=UPI0026722207|nr:long-chain-fatty-acid--CoA ligase FadD17 [Mycolicibacterium neoaurum]MDO3400033.1 long-chain-fatty-acid--CoA ligase FadD17 [Mycolicibacterium neoaurum]
MDNPTGPTVGELLAPLVEVTDRGVHDEESFTPWRDHITAGAALAAALRARLDPARPPHIGVLLGNTRFFSSVLVAAALSGLVPVGLNPTRRGAALAADAERADCQFVLADSGADVPAGVVAVDVESDSWARELAAHSGTPVTFAPLSGDDLFMLIFTSGTSGEPKAVQVTNDKVAFPGRMLAERFGLGPTDTCYLSMPLFHSNAVMAGWAVGVAAGASIALRRKFSASRFIPDARRFGATYANYVGKPLSYILATPEQPDDADNPLKFLYGNEGAPRDLPRFAERFGVHVVDGFGSTEGGVAIARTPDTPDGSLGPLTDEVAIVDIETGVPCPPGVVGEIVNPRGPGWFRGYYNSPDAEAERMSGGIYHSGDLAYRDDDGYVYFAGRLGDWMRVDGENLGTAPIERILLRHLDITEVAVYPIPDPAVGDRVMAAIVLAEGAVFDPEAFRAFLADQPDLGPKQWPSFVRVATELPRTETFKVLKRELSAQALDCPDPVYPCRRG